MAEIEVEEKRKRDEAKHKSAGDELTILKAWQILHGKFSIHKLQWLQWYKILFPLSDNFFTSLLSGSGRITWESATHERNHALWRVPNFQSQKQVIFFYANKIGIFHTTWIARRMECYGWDLRNQADYVKELEAKQQRERDRMYQAGLEEEELYQRKIKVGGTAEKRGMSFWVH